MKNVIQWILSIVIAAVVLVGLFYAVYTIAINGYLPLLGIALAIIAVGGLLWMFVATVKEVIFD